MFIYNYNSRSTQQTPKRHHPSAFFPNHSRRKERRKNGYMYTLMSAIFLVRVFKQPQIASPRPLLSRPSFQVRVRRLFLSVAVFRRREGVHAKRRARRNGQKRHRSPLVHFSCCCFLSSASSKRWMVFERKRECQAKSRKRRRITRVDFRLSKQSKTNAIIASKALMLFSRVSLVFHF